MRVIPSFCAINPERIGYTFLLALCRVMVSEDPLSGRRGISLCILQLDFDVDAGGEIELHQCVYRLRGRVHNVKQTLVGPDLELLASLLVDVRRAVDGELVDAGRQRDGTANLGTRTLGGVDDLAGRRIEHAMVKRLEADADILTVHLLKS